MRKFTLALAGLVLLLGTPIFAEDMKMEPKHTAAMCEKHCNIMELEKQVELLKTQAATAGKVATKEHLKKDIETYEKKLKDLETELDTMK